nr:MAG: hypothetical protein [Microvirus sp.]
MENFTIWINAHAKDVVYVATALWTLWQEIRFRFFKK